MFTGIISELGTIQKLIKNKQDTVFTIRAPKTCKSLKIGDSVAVNGACHTVVRLTSKKSFGRPAYRTGRLRTTNEFTVESIPETLKRTNLDDLKAGSKANLERPLKSSGRLDGHFVTGHIDGVAKIVKITPHKNSVLFEFAIPKNLAKFIVEKGSVALDGISLTVIKIAGSKLTVGIIPHTLTITTLGLRKIGECVNLETDILAKHLAKLIRQKKKRIY